MEYQIEDFTLEVDFYNVLDFEINGSDYVYSNESSSSSRFIGSNSNSLNNMNQDSIIANGKFKSKNKNDALFGYDYNLEILKHHHLDRIGHYLDNRNGNVNANTKKPNLEYSTKPEAVDDSQIYKIMNGAIKDYLEIIPDDVTWDGQSGEAFMAQIVDFMKPAITSVDYLLENDVEVNIWNGQLDLICCTLGTLEWMTELTWDGYDTFADESKIPVYSIDAADVAYFKQDYKNLKFYYIMKAGHMVPADNGYAAIEALCDITGVSCDVSSSVYDDDQDSNYNLIHYDARYLDKNVQSKVEDSLFLVKIVVPSMILIGLLLYKLREWRICCFTSSGEIKVIEETKQLKKGEGRSYQSIGFV